MKRSTTVTLITILVMFFGAVAIFAQKGPSSSHGPSINAGPSSQGHDKDKGSSHDNQAAQGTKGHDHDADFEQKIERNPQLKAKLTSLLPPNTDLKTAAMGFKNEGQFIAALHVAKNLGISFTDLKAKMTGPMPESLGKAIHDLKPALSESQAKEEAEKAEKLAKNDEKAPKTPPTS
jgi:hypothetical protein